MYLEYDKALYFNPPKPSFMNYFSCYFIRVLTALLCLLSLAHAQTPLVPLNIGSQVLHVEKAQTVSEREKGLMWRSSLPSSQGMLFVFEQAEKTCFWMKNTLIPLSIAFVQDDGKILQIIDMSPLSEDIHCANHPVRYAVEVNAGWFDTHNIKEGQSFKGGPFTSAATPK